MSQRWTTDQAIARRAERLTLDGRQGAAWRPAALTALVLLSVVLGQPALAQTESIRWAEPVRLSEPTAIIQDYTLAADDLGGLHVFWSPKAGTANANLLFYTHSNGRTWSEPTDLFFGPENVDYTRPYVLHHEGMLYLLWTAVDGLHFSSVPAQNATDTKAWSADRVIVQGPSLASAHLVVDSKGTLHVTYAIRRTGANVEYVRSTDGGQTWSLPRAVSAIVPQDAQAPGITRLAIDQDDVLHLVWDENYPPEYVGRQILYARSTDHGATWEEPLPLSPLSRENQQDGSPSWGASPSLAVDSQGRLHLVWVCGSVGRCYRSSSDGGRSWSASHTLFRGLIGWSGWDTMAADPYGGVYWMGALRYPQAFYTSTRRDGIWEDPPAILFDKATAQVPGLADGHWPHLVIAEGNQFHLLLVESDGGALWYVHGESSQPHQEPTPHATATPVPTSAPKMTQASETRLPRETQSPETGTRTVSNMPDQSREARQSELIPLLWVALPVISVISVVFIVKSRHDDHERRS